MASLPIPIHPFLSRIPAPISRPRVSARKNEWIEKKGRVQASYRGLEVLYDDRYGSVNMEGYIDAVNDLIKFDGGPPRWFCPVECGAPIQDSPLLLFLPDIDGNGMGLFLHHKALGRIFEVRCMHIPINDHTPFEGLVKFVEDVLRLEHSICPNKPIYLIGHSFGGCLALSVAARNPHIDLILILSNPATSFGKSELQPLEPILASFSNRLNIMVQCLLNINIGHRFKMALGSNESGYPALQTRDKPSRNLSSPLLHISTFLNIIPRETVSWKLKLLRSATCYANSRLHAVKAEVLVLSSCKDKTLPSRDEAERLGTSLNNCRIRYFSNHGHNLLLEDDIHLSTIIKGTTLYRHSRQHDHVSDYLPPSMRELEAYDQAYRLFRLASSPVMFSTLEDGKIVRGLSGVPNDGPVLLVGNHMLLAVDLVSLIPEFLREKGVIIRGISHPILFEKMDESSSQELSVADSVKVFGGVPISASYFYRLLSTKSFVLLYPGGAREAVHRKGEEYKLFWPGQPEFVRMSTQFGAKIVPFAAVGEDDMGELVLDYDDMMSIPFLKDSIEESNHVFKLRTSVIGEREKQEMLIPWLLPKIPGRIYYLFGKPIETSGRLEVLNDKESANDLYLHVKSEIESSIAYLRKKREEDMYRGIFQRIIYQATWGPTHQVPTFEP